MNFKSGDMDSKYRHLFSSVHIYRNNRRHLIDQLLVAKKSLRKSLISYGFHKDFSKFYIIPISYAMNIPLWHDPWMIELMF